MLAKLFAGVTAIRALNCSKKNAAFRYFSVSAASTIAMRRRLCASVTSADVGQSVSLWGWVENIRNTSSNLSFLVLRDHTSRLQLVIDSQCPSGLLEQAKTITPESVIYVEGTVASRGKNVNPAMGTGEVEVRLSSLKLLNKAHDFPIPLKQLQESDELTRLTHRVLDLRTDRMQRNLRIRSLATSTVRRILEENGFLEIETPTLFKPTPEGAKEFLVFSSREKGQVYALPQSPQQYKQMLMAAGMDRYYQFARCYRDESNRADRQPEFTQIDMELSVIEREDIYNICEKLLSAVWKNCLHYDLPTPFPKLQYQDAIAKFGIDKPDLRFDYSHITKLNGCFSANDTQLNTVKYLLEQAENVNNNSQESFNQPLSVRKSEGVVLGVLLRGFDKLLSSAARNNVKKDLGEDIIVVQVASDGKWKSSLARHMSNIEVENISKLLGQPTPGDMILISMGTGEKPYLDLGKARLSCLRLQTKLEGKEKELEKIFKPVWIEGFPLLSPDDNDPTKLVSTHHPFTAAVEEDVHLLTTSPERVRGQHYDCVMNGMELGGGSIRIHDADQQLYIMKNIIGLDDENVKRFDHLIKSLRTGCPPHGGLAFGFDRMVTVLCAESSIRDVIAFPKTGTGKELLTGSPSQATPQQLQDLGLALAKG